MAHFVEPVTLEGKLVRLEPLGLQHAQGLYEASQDQILWRFIPHNPSRSLADMEAFIKRGLQQREKGSEFPFAIIERASGKIIGSTRYMTITPADRGLEIGSTWLTPARQRTGVNTECKYLLLSHAFEKLGAIRVQLKTDSRNLQSQRAIERLGAVKEGILRNHLIMPDGYYRHSVYYSILDSEWPAVKAGLEQKMQR
ncbi:N-acetyltransferase [Ktedonosporobacter rubrisoli]|uniref:N-acetyltransferase n=1 Tax=Ktedonosporobacter rubrisoli TaxID=2509675 RepID=A0A4P6JXU7_KTERU|nr:GNAT family protein [Ktedonosporobacter rubrisoli]QBD80598.1 N-acetyltransferase [Ktedonosporobacter rubrisoli]